MPHSHNLDQPPRVIDAVNNPVGSDNNLTNGWDAVLGDDSSNLWKILQLVGFCNEAIAIRLCSLRTVTRDEVYDVVQVIAGGRRPNQFVSHEANCFLISSWAMPSPRSSWSRPFCTAARNSTRSAISSIEQSSGNSRIVFRTTSFSVMRKIMLPGHPKRKRFRHTN